jgi:DNA-binding PadR family transcriptional regulator
MRSGPSDEAELLEQELCHPKGHLRVCLLFLLAKKPAHGYELADSVKPLGYDNNQPATTYRALRWLGDAGLVNARWETPATGPARRIFELTSAGSRMTKACAVAWQATSEAFREELSQVLSEGDDPGHV